MLRSLCLCCLLSFSLFLLSSRLASGAPVTGGGGPPPLGPSTLRSMEGPLLLQLPLLGPPPMLLIRLNAAPYPAVLAAAAAAAAAAADDDDAELRDWAAAATGI